jgi:hypothetical protein
MELDAPVSEVWKLMGDLSRFPEYSAGLERVEAKTDENGRCIEYTCYFGDLYRFDRFAAPEKLWDGLQARFPELLKAR